MLQRKFKEVSYGTRLRWLILLVAKRSSIHGVDTGKWVSITRLHTGIRDVGFPSGILSARESLHSLACEYAPSKWQLVEAFSLIHLRCPAFFPPRHILAAHPSWPQLPHSWNLVPMPNPAQTLTP